jgi:hypothetical protein
VIALEPNGVVAPVHAKARIGLGAAGAGPVGPDPGEGEQRSLRRKRELDHVLLACHRVRRAVHVLQRLWIGDVVVFRKAGGRHETAAFGLQLEPPVRRRGVADVGNRRAAELRRARHAPARHGQFTLVGVGAHDRRHMVGKDRR